ncbi:LuxR C-terminal-related transcriptional regulator [Anaerolinea sp.]|uniref:LuxR C-terminal-related transcriptional regulator n=1 Tax=Anaerolinea sp. TaxID=1872519 RepID=UPI002ACDFD72|nr:LuxR C-terminal-related transcriptional regulator [Anaerolinea sp.]
MFYYNESMNLWEWLRGWWRAPGKSARTFEVSQRTEDLLRALAQQTGIPESRLAEQLIHSAVETLHLREDLRRRWLMLTPREQQAVALACLGYTNRQIAQRMGISPETVKTHLRNAMMHFDVHSKSELRRLLADWDFSSWENPPRG